MKNHYDEPKMEVIFLEKQDVISTSSTNMEEMIKPSDDFNGGILH